MPKGDSLCPLGFHPQFRRPTYCKRCFREYSEHKVTGSSTSINSSFDRNDYGSRDSLSSRRDEDGLTRSRSDLTSSSFSRNDNQDKISKGAYTGQRPMSWSAQDLQEAVENAKEEIRRDPPRVYGYGSRRSLTQDLGSLDRSSPRERKERETSKETESSPKSFFSSYLSSKSKGSLTHSTSMNEESSGSRYSSDSKPPRPPSKSPVPPADSEKTTSEKPKRNIQSLREVKSMDADASYVIQLRPKKKKEKPVEAKKPEADVEGSDNQKLRSDLKTLQEEIERLKLKNTDLEATNKELSAKRTRFSDARKQSDISKLQSQIDDLTKELKEKNNEISSMKTELSKKPSPTKTSKVEGLREELATVQKLCQRLTLENEESKREIRLLEDEIEEMQDSFREDDDSQCKLLKKELEIRTKDCRVLDFKLKKAVARSCQMELDKAEAENKLKELQLSEGEVDRAERVKLIENELALAKEVSLKMHDEMEKMKAQLQIAESDKKKLKEKVHATPFKPTGKISRSQIIGRPGGQEMSDENLSREIQISREREQDMKEKMELLEEESKNLRNKLSRSEEENETLQLQLNKMTAKSRRQRSIERTGSYERSNSVERGPISRQNSGDKYHIPINSHSDDELDPTELKIQLELNEEESSVLRRKVDSLENDNIRLQKELKDLLSSLDSKKSDTSESSSSKDSIYYAKKVRSLEEELSDQRKEMSSLEKQKNQLQTDLELAKKRPKIARTRSSELAESDDKKKLEMTEKENETLKKKNLDLENAITKLTEDTKKLKRTRSSTVESDTKVKDLEETVSQLTQEIDGLRKDNEEMKNSSPYKNRVAKKPKDITPKTTLVKWVNELENECAKLNVKLKMSETEKEVLEKMSGAPRDRKGSVDSEMCHLLFTECDTLRSENDTLKTNLDQKETEHQTLKDQIKEFEKQLKEKTNGSLDPQELLNWTPPKLTDLTPKSSLKKMVDDLIRQCALLHKALTEKSDGGVNVTELQEELRKEKEVSQELAKQLTEAKDSKGPIRKRFGATSKDDDAKAITSLKKEINEYKEKISDLENQNSSRKSNMEELHNLQTDKHKLQKEVSTCQQSIESLQKKLDEAETIKKSFEKTEKNLQAKLNEASKREEKLIEEQKSTQDMEQKAKSEKEKCRKLQKEKDNLQIEYALVKENINSMEREKERIIARHKKELDQEKKSSDDLKSKLSTLENDLKACKTKCDRLEQEGSSGKLKGLEIQEYKDRLKRVETEKSNLSVQIEKLRQESVSQIKDLERTNKKDAKLLEEIQKKYDLLEEDFVIQKAQLTMNNDQSYIELKNEYDVIETELKTLRETYNTHKDTWIKEKLEMQVQVIDMEDRLKKESNGGPYSEKRKLRSIIDDKTQQIDSLKAETDTIRDQLSYHKKEADDLKRKVEDLEKLQDIADKRQNSSANDSRGYESTIKELKTKLSALEKSHRTEHTKLKMRYDTKLKALSEEVSATAHHMSKYRKERDTYKEMLDGAQKTIADLKGNSSRTYRSSRADNATEAKAHLSEVQDMQATITELEDKLADSRLQGTKLKNDLVDNKTTFEIQLSEMQTKLNEYEEDRLLTGGGRRLPGLRTRLELNWQKEREEQQRLIQETTTLAKDLRQTLYEVERERDMERLEAKRKIEQLRKSVSMEHQDTKGKVSELQRDLQELREAHAKLRQINEKLRREKDRTEVEREAMRDKFLGSSREHLNQMTKMEKLLEQMNKVKDLSPLVLGESIDGRESSLNNLPTDPTPKTRGEFTDALKRIARHAEDMRHLMGFDDYGRRTPLLRKGLSMESDDEAPSGRSRSVTKGAIRPRSRAQKSQLYRKAQSLDHHMADESNKIWVSTDQGSVSSIDSSRIDNQEIRRNRYDFDSSMERMSTGSQTSEIEPEPRKKGLKGMLSKFGRTKSIEESSTAGSIVGAGMKALAPGMTGSGNSISSEPDPGSSVKGKIKTLFKKNTRSQSNDRDDGVRPTARKLDSDQTDDVPGGGDLRKSELSENLHGIVQKAKDSIRAQSGSFETEV